MIFAFEKLEISVALIKRRIYTIINLLISSAETVKRELGDRETVYAKMPRS